MNNQKHYSGTFCTFIGLAGMLLLVFGDQYTKWLAAVHLKNQPAIPLIKDVLELKYLYPENRGIAFGMFQGKVNLFLFLSVLFFVLLIYVFVRIPKTAYYLPMLITLNLMAAGAVGNFIDRLFRGYVIDFIYISLIDFPVFNLADIYVVVSGCLLVLVVGFKYKEEDFGFLSLRKKS